MRVSLRDFVVFESLTVHQLKVKPKQVKAIYTLLPKDGEPVSTELIYSYPEAIFRPDDPGDLNLAAMMVAQVAMNYGLFCEEIIFHGPFDRHDQRLIQDMTENTSREIYVHKLLQRTGFLRPAYEAVEVERKSKYTAARLVFRGAGFPDAPPPSPCLPDREQYAILSSGGKDSLLSYGLLNEHFDAHPIYVNESGRHWYTAYNAYHHLMEVEPRTARVWCNCDRVFNWMVRQMPFIKPNFQQIRADHYPIRLWTVSVFLWGVLPLARYRNIGNIVIGNEYDTSIQTQYEGITHYAGLYDQSRWFDNAYTRYYQRKGWNFYQFSLLRPLSELLILEMLAKRYPHLQEHQISCHASHKEGDRMVPCGNCEKCRRIVGMLTALDDDPHRCGYSDDQISRCLEALTTKSVKQIGPDAAHLYHLLDQKGKIDLSPAKKSQLRPRPEVVSLRYDQERSRLEDLPLATRQAILPVYRAFSESIVQMKDRKWQVKTEGEIDWDQPYWAAPRT